MMRFFYSFWIFLGMGWLVSVSWVWADKAENLDLIKLQSGVILDGYIAADQGPSITIETVGGSISVLKTSIASISRSRPGESALLIGLQLLQRKKIARADGLLKKAAFYPAWRKEAKDGLDKLARLQVEEKETQREKEKEDIERLIQNRGVKAGIEELQRRNKEEDEYWGNYRGRLHLIMARQKMDHLDFRGAEDQLALAEKYGVTQEEWEKVRNEIIAMRKQSLLFGKDALALQNRVYTPGKKPPMASSWLKTVTLSKKVNFKIPPESLLQLVDRYAYENQLDPFLVWALIDIESNWDTDAVSPKGAQGLMQLMPGTAKDLEVSNPFNPEENIKGGTQYLKYLLDTFNDTGVALAAYNVGPGRIERANAIPAAGNDYIQKVMGRYSYLQGRFGKTFTKNSSS